MRHVILLHLVILFTAGCTGPSENMKGERPNIVWKEVRKRKYVFAARDKMGIAMMP